MSRRAVGALLLGLIVLAPLAIGTVHVVTRTIAFGACALALALTIAERRGRKRELVLSLPALALGVAVVATALQLVPLPASLLARISPAAHELFSMTLGDYRWHALSLDPAGTVAELAKLAAYLAFFVAATGYASRAHRRMQIAVAIAAVATLAAILGFFQAAAGASKLLFFYTPQAGPVGDFVVRGPFVNPNHFGALMCLGAPCALAVGLREPKLRWAAFPAAIVINVAVVLSLSRSAIIAAPIAQLVTFVVDRLQARRGRALIGSGLRGALAVAAVAGMGVAGSFVAERLDVEARETRKAELSDPLGDPHSKFYSWSQAVTMADAYPWTGAGRGAFEQGFARYSTVAGSLRFPWIENEYLQALADWGLPVTLLLGVLGLWALVLVIRRLQPDPLIAGALGALVALSIHDAADFSLEIPGIGLPALALLATLFARTRTGSEPGLRRLRVPALAYLAPLLLAVPVALATMRPLATADAEVLGRITRDGKATPAQILAAGEAARARHPADYFIHLLVAGPLARAHHPAAMRWLNQTIYLNPDHPMPHVMAAELLADSGHKAQALLEYRTAVERSVAPGAIWDLVIARYPATPDLLAATPETAPHLDQLAGFLLATGRKADAEAAYAHAVELDPRDITALLQLATLAIDRGDIGAARARAEALLAVDPSLTSHRVRARAHILAGELDAAAAIIDGLADRSTATFELELVLARAFSLAGNSERARRRLEALAWATDVPSRIRVHEARAEVEDRAGNAHQATWEREQAGQLRGK